MKVLLTIRCTVSSMHKPAYMEKDEIHFFRAYGVLANVNVIVCKLCATCMDVCAFAVPGSLLSCLLHRPLDITSILEEADELSSGSSTNFTHTESGTVVVKNNGLIASIVVIGIVAMANSDNEMRR